MYFLQFHRNTMCVHTVVYIFLLKVCYADLQQGSIIQFDKVERNLGTNQGNEHVIQGNARIMTQKDTQEFPQRLFTLPLSDTEGELSARREKRQGEARTINFDSIGQLGPGIGPGIGLGIDPSPLCFEREVTGTCRYRTAPDECFHHEWTAYATIINRGYKKIISIPGNLLVHPENHERVRVFVKSSCCNPVVEFIATDFFFQPTPCIVDVRELQHLHPGEIAGIVVGVLLFIIIVIAIILICLRRQRTKKLEKETVIFGRSLTRSKSRGDDVVINRH